MTFILVVICIQLSTDPQVPWEIYIVFRTPLSGGFCEQIVIFCATPANLTTISTQQLGVFLRADAGAPSCVTHWSSNPFAHPWYRRPCPESQRFVMGINGYR